jgi:hypothetical protein
MSASFLFKHKWLLQQCFEIVTIILQDAAFIDRADHKGMFLFRGIIKHSLERLPVHG